MTTNTSYQAALNTLLTIAQNSNSLVKEYWLGILNAAKARPFKGTVQSTVSNPVAYFVVPLSGDGLRGRSHNFVLDQFRFALVQGWTKDADKKLRGVDEHAIKAGLSFNIPKCDSKRLGNVADRNLAAQAAREARQGVDVSRQAAIIAALPEANKEERVNLKSRLAAIAADLQAALALRDQGLVEEVMQTVSDQDAVSLMASLPEIKQADAAMLAAVAKKRAKERTKAKVA